jgi:hypothetical protein
MNRRDVDQLIRRSPKGLAMLSAAMMLAGPVAAQQQPGADFPDGAAKSDVVAICGGCMTSTA